ncbi:hypothetical protein MLD38_003048 [Melastoma candidum]|uniref:Uncharacterized protein n=1 Tax=Melastoma candidum TaxID=119954 RepID=A0ACB9S9W6_9MYRT|nr:hypothetical protein MLD38_003048 [Melastoma candidum]
MGSRGKEKLKLLIAVASVAFLTAFFAARLRRRRKQRRGSVSCYLHADQELKLQYTFRRVLADNSYSPFKHLRVGDSCDEHNSTSHPFEAEIMGLLDASRLDFEFLSDEELKRIDSFVWVEEEQQLKELADLLCKEKSFAVDTEQHSFRSFLGFTALMQISTQKENYLIDTIRLHDAIEILRPAFSDPRICKVFHGADNDVLWLQRDFHIYVVNLFDTAKACDLLSKPQRSLAYLLESYCGITTNKMLQREDWRQRPLPAEMVQYAQIDAQYLLYIANCLVSELKEKDQESSPDHGLNFVLEAFRRSNMICLQLYSKDSDALPGEAAASSIMVRHMNCQGGDPNALKAQDVIQRLCAWREVMARVHDESLRYVLGDQAIVALAEKTPLHSSDICDTIIQAEMNSDLINSSLPVPSPLVDSHVDDIFHLFSEKIGGIDEIFSSILEKSLGQNGTCPLSIFNYGLFRDSTMRLHSKALSRHSGATNLRQASRKPSRELFVQKFSCKSPVYHNCRIFANDGRLLCYCDRRKLEWYLCRNLAKIVEEDPPAIMLLFEPKGRPEDEDNEFYIQSKKNICVGCGEENHYLRYRIIPSCYRMHFPEHLKSHRSHDIVLLCVDCHEIAHAAAEKYKRKVAEEFRIPLFVRNIVDLREMQVSSDSSQSLINFEKTGVSPLELRTAAMALIRHGQKMPSNRRDELMEVVKRFYGGRDLSDDDLQKALLVGMSSYERKRFQKKSGLSSKNFKCDSDLDEVQRQGNASTERSSPVNGADACELDGSFTMVDKCGDSDDKILSAGSQNKGIADSRGSNQCSNADNGCLSSNEVVNTSDVERKGDCDTPKNNSKISLLGHGPHGKQVVEHILKEQGEDGISLFCQRWRQVFVEAVHPRFLPAGWDVKHSGRRDFGEYSVYNTSRRTYAVAS